MSFRPLTTFLMVFGVACAAQAAPLSPAKLKAVALDSATDNISSGWCGRGMLSILTKAGLGRGLQGSNGQDWEANLIKAGWRPVKCMTPFTAPLGSVLVYSSDTRLGKRNRGTPGGSYGHVEMVALGNVGQRLYVSDNPRPLPGGSVRDNFTGRAWLPPGSMIAKAPTGFDQVDAVLQERFRLAQEHFKSSHTPQQLATTKEVSSQPQ